jgi:hypothetical protein
MFISERISLGNSTDILSQYSTRYSLIDRKSPYFATAQKLRQSQKKKFFMLYREETIVSLIIQLKWNNSLLEVH